METTTSVLDRGISDVSPLSGISWLSVHFSVSPLLFFCLVLSLLARIYDLLSDAVMNRTQSVLGGATLGNHSLEKRWLISVKRRPVWID